MITSNEVTINCDGKSRSLSKSIAVIQRDFVDEDCQIRNHADLFQQPCEVVIFQQNNNAQHVQIMESPATWQTTPTLPIMQQVSISQSSLRMSKSSDDLSGYDLNKEPITRSQSLQFGSNADFSPQFSGSSLNQLSQWPMFIYVILDRSVNMLQ